MNNLPYRQRAEILIHFAGKVLITVNESDDGVWYGLPGGGLDEGDTPEQGAVREALEEVGVAVKNVRHSGAIGTKEGYKARDAKKHREAAYRGSQTHLIEADFDRFDFNLLAEGDDATEYTWMTPARALEVLSGNSGSHQKEVLQRYL